MVDRGDKAHETFIFDIKIDINICEPHYVNLFFFVNLLHSLHVWLFDIWHLFDNLTSFWHFDTSIKLKPPQPAQGYFVSNYFEFGWLFVLMGQVFVNTTIKFWKKNWVKIWTKNLKKKFGAEFTSSQIWCYLIFGGDDGGGGGWGDLGSKNQSCSE